MNSRTRVLAISLVGLALVALAAWRIVGERPNASGPDLPAIAEASSAPLELEGGRDGGRSTTQAASDATSSATIGTGTLNVRVVDDASGKPLAGIAVRLARERGGDKLLATGTTDERGEARFDAVEANTVIVEALRKPPYARTFGAVWLEPREHEEVVLRLGTGATVTGRVVDDLGTPIAGVDILLGDDFAPRFGAKSWIHGSSAVAARSSADGRFTLANLARLPGRVWIENDAMKPEQWAWPAVWLRFEDAAVPVTIDLRDEAGQDLGDLVIPRAATWSGHVLDARGHAVSGALVSSIDGRLQSRRGAPRSGHPELAGWPGGAAFSLWPGEATSGPDGSFELRGRFKAKRVSVITRAATRHEFAVPTFEPGARFEGLELRIEDATMLVIELVDRAGQRIEEPPLRTRTVYRSGKRLPDTQLQVDVHCAFGNVSASAGSDPDGLFRIQVESLAGAAESLIARMGGYQPVEHTLAGDPSEVLRFVLEELPVVRVRLRIPGEPQGPEATPRNLVLHACVRDPAEWNDLPPEERASPGCCGLGAFSVVPCRPGVTDVELTVAAERPFFVGVRSLMDPSTATFGPWIPGPDWHPIDVPLPESEPLVVATKRVRAVPARVRARLVDARTGDSIEGYVDFSEPRPESRQERFDLPNVANAAAGAGRWRDVAPGHWLATARAPGYSPSAPREVDLVADVEHDLGTFALEPLPRVEVLVLDGSGDPVPEGVRLYFSEPQRTWSSNGMVRGKAGRLVLHTVFPATGFVVVDESLVPSLVERGGRSQTLPFTYDGSGDLTLRLAPWRRVEVRIETIDLVEREGAIDVRLFRDPAQDPELGPWQQQLGEGPSDARRRSWSGWVGPGRYTLRCQSLLLRFPETQLDISASDDEVVRVDLRPER